MEWRLVWSTCVNGDSGISAAWPAHNIRRHFVCLCAIVSPLCVCVLGIDGRGLCAADGSSIAGPFLHYHNNGPQSVPAAQEQQKSPFAPLPTHCSVCDIMSAFTHLWLIQIVNITIFTCCNRMLLLLSVSTELCWTVKASGETSLC